MLPTRAMMRTTVKTKNLAACSSGAPFDRVGCWIGRQREFNTRFGANIGGRCGRGAAEILDGADSCLAFYTRLMCAIKQPASPWRTWMYSTSG
jgi:hypothetical protein